jgi:hypothetical protein
MAKTPTDKYQPTNRGQISEYVWQHINDATPAMTVAEKSQQAAKDIAYTGLPSGVSTTTVNGVTKTTAPVQAAAQAIIADPNSVLDKAKTVLSPSNFLDMGGRGLSILGSIFDSSDEADWGNPVTAQVENVWDTMLRGVGYFYDGINRLSTAAVSALPGGTQTLDWSQTENVSFGQEMVANAGIIAGDIKNGRGNPLSIAGGIATNPLVIIGLLTDSNNAIEQPGWDILSEQDRKVFESGWEKFGSGSMDTAFTILADPFIIGGKVLKLTRLKYLDRPYSAENNVKMWGEIESAVTEISTNPAVKPASPFGGFIHDTLATDANGAKIMPLREIMSRGEIGSTKVGESVAAALHANKDPEIAGHILKSAMGNEISWIALAEKDAQAADTLIRARKMQYWDDAVKGDLQESISKAEKEVVKSQDVYDAVAVARQNLKATEKEVKAASARLEIDTEVARALRMGEYPSFYLGPQATAGRSNYIDRLVASAEKNSEAFALANSDKISFASASDNIRFATDTALGRVVSKGRAARAKAAYQQKASQSMDHSVISEDFFGNSVGKRTLRIWRRLGNIRSNSYVDTTPENVKFSGDIGANLDEIKALSNEFIPLKEKIFTNIVRDFSKGDPNEAINKLESTIISHLSSFYGIREDVVKQVVEQMKSKENEFASQIKSGKSKFFISDNETLDRIPDIESQLQNGRYLIPWSDVEKAIIRQKQMDPTGAIFNELTPSAAQWSADKVKNGYLVFNDLWRPLVLFRLGYTQRNVAEGVFRSSAYMSSAAPIMWALKGASKGISGNFRREQGLFKIAKKSTADKPVYRIKSKAQKERDKLESLLGDTRPVVWDQNVTALQSAQVEERAKVSIITHLTRMQARPAVTPDEISQMIERFLPGEGGVTAGMSLNDIVKYYDYDLKLIAQRKNQLENTIAAAPRRSISPSVGGTKFAQWREDKLDSLLADITQDISFESQMVREAGGMQNLTEVAKDNLVFLRQGMEAKRVKMTAMEQDDAFALQEYMSQPGVGTKKIVKVGDERTVNGYTMETAFSDPLTVRMHWEKMSANNTIKRTMTARDRAQSSVLQKKLITDYVQVDPGQPNYWDGMERMLRGYSNSYIVKRILAGDTNESIANWLILNPKGKELSKLLDEAAEVVHAENPSIGPAPIGGRIGDDPDKAFQFVAEVKQKLISITGGGNEDVLQIMRTRAPSSSELESILAKDVSVLKPVVGFTEEFAGSTTMMQTWRSINAKAFEVIGSTPEDALVRGPFYQKSYVTARDKILATLIPQYRNGQIPIDRLRQVEMASHRIALGETKEWLYTIDNRTFLGHYTEWIAPFISASQNSATVLGKLIRRDPALPGIMASLWNAPNKAGWEDKQGNVFIPLPMDLVPESIKATVGLSGFTGLTINKSQLNVIFPESGFAFVPRPTPLVQVAASEIMKAGWFGMGPEAPALLVNVLGAQNADAWWQHTKDYVFGEDQGMSDNIGSFDKVVPPWMNKAFQLWQDQGASEYAYQYGLQARTQELRYQAGLRTAPASAEEITNMTNGNYVLRMAMNLLAFTPPNYVSSINPVIEVGRMFDQQYGIDGPLMMNETFGPEIQLLSKTNTTRNVGGATPDDMTVRNIKKYGPLIEKITAATGEADLSILGIIVNDNRELTGDPAVDINGASPYDVNAYRWMSQSNIPGTSRQWRELLTGPESIAESQRLAGWTEFTKFSDGIDALLHGAGIDNYRKKEAAPYNNMRIEFTNRMMANPLYVGWRSDKLKMSSSKPFNTIAAITTALNDEQFMQDNGSSRTWQAAARYVMIRDEVSALVRQSGHGIDAEVNQDLADSWATAQQQLKASDIRWANIANRFLANDDLLEVGPTSDTIRQGVA